MAEDCWEKNTLPFSPLFGKMLCNIAAACHMHCYYASGEMHHPAPAFALQEEIRVLSCFIFMKFRKR